MIGCHGHAPDRLRTGSARLRRVASGEQRGRHRRGVLSLARRKLSLDGSRARWSSALRSGGLPRCVLQLTEHSEERSEDSEQRGAGGARLSAVQHRAGDERAQLSMRICTQQWGPCGRVGCLTQTRAVSVSRGRGGEASDWCSTRTSCCASARLPHSNTCESRTEECVFARTPALQCGFAHKRLCKRRA